MSQIKGLKLLLAAILVTVFLLPIGICWNIGKSIIESFQLRFWKGSVKFIKYWGFLFYQTYRALDYGMMHLAVTLDLIWNASSGEFIEDMVTDEEKTLFGKGEVTVSAAIGRQETYLRLNKKGKWFSRLLDVAFNEKEHCKNAYKSEVDKKYGESEIK